MPQLCMRSRTTVKRPRQRLHAALMAAMATPLLFSSSANAQNAGRWYEIEMIFFNQGLGKLDRQELWPNHIELTYPNSVKVLAETPEPAISGEPTNPLNTDEESVEVDGIPRTTPFQRLDDEHKRLLKLAQKIKASGRHRILAHWVWQQPFMGRDNADSIAIYGGKAFDDHYELEGSIDLSVGRYLHLATNLWLTRFTPITDELETFNPWPPLPRHPSQATASEVDFLSNGPEASNHSVENDTAEKFSDASASQENSLQKEATTDTAFIEVLPTAEQEFITTLEDAVPELISRQYETERIALIREKRRMRSATLHFIDHPLMGILIEIRRVNKE